MYEVLKWLHVAAVIASGTGFVARSALMIVRSPRLDSRFARIAPHLIDTVLLAAAIAMLTLARISPHSHPWLAAKIAALIVYIVLGAVALRYGRTRRVRALALVGALAAFAYIVGTALQRDPAWPLRLA